MQEDPVSQLSSQEFLRLLENEGRMRIDNFIEGAVELAEGIHSGLVREDMKSSFLETHTWPVAMEVVRHYLSINRNITSAEVATAILHDIMEDDDRILDFHQSKSYGFEAYLSYRFGPRLHRIATELKVKPLSNYPGSSEEERQAARFQEYCDILVNADYDVKVIKLADRLNNMTFISQVPEHEKIKRYLREAEDFYLAYSMLEPKMPEFYRKFRNTYEGLKFKKAILT